MFATRYSTREVIYRFISEFIPMRDPIVADSLSVIEDLRLLEIEMITREDTPKINPTNVKRTQVFVSLNTIVSINF